MEQIRADAAALRRAAREADIELATMVAMARSKRRKPNREWHLSRPGDRAGELGEDPQVGMEPDPVQPTDPER